MGDFPKVSVPSTMSMGQVILEMPRARPQVEDLPRHPNVAVAAASRGDALHMPASSRHDQMRCFPDYNL